MPLAKSPRHAKSPASATLRIIGGRHRGRKLPIPALDGLRPTADRTRETLFNWLQFELPGMTVLDLFAGTGALGLEALSRDAASAVFIEPQRAASAALRQSLVALQQTNAEVLSMTAEQFLAGPAQGFDLIFVDPPFSADLWQSTLTQLMNGPWLKKGGYVYLECPKNQIIDLPAQLTPQKDKTSGQVRFRLLQKAD